MMKELSINSEIFTRGVEDMVTKEELAKRLGGKKQLRIKLGIDATGPDLHIGHAVNLWKIRALQEAGHKAVIVLGEFTTRIGDPGEGTGSQSRRYRSELEQPGPGIWRPAPVRKGRTSVPARIGNL